MAGTDYEIVVVDDNSPDGTAKESRALVDNFPVKTIVRTEERGLSTAVVEGLAHASGGIVVVMDADLQHPPETIPALVREIENGADLAVASRYVPGGQTPGLNLIRKLASRGATVAAHLLLPATRSASDPMSGFFAFRRSVLNGAVLKPVGFKILMEILGLGKYDKVAEVPISFEIRDQGQSKLRFRQQVDYLIHLISLSYRSGEMLRFCKFCIVGLSGVGVNLGLLWLLTEKAGLHYLASAAISIETSIISNFLLNNVFTFSDYKSRRAGTLLTRMLKFNLVSAVGLSLNWLALWLFTEVVGLYYLISNCIGIVFATIWNYLANRNWTWKIR
jgi:dolichol-phosphate mannosyltransferase